MKYLSSLIILVIFLMVTLANAVGPVGQRNIDRLVNGGPETIRNVAKSMYNTGERDTKVLDVLAEVMLRDYKTTNPLHVDAISWGANALGASGNPRYRDVLTEIRNNAGHRKTKKYAKKALKKLERVEAEQYTKGTVSITELKSVKVAPKSEISVKPATMGDKSVGLSVIREGMGKQEVYDLVGHPTSTIERNTGKGWNPFNVAGHDVVRSIALYKGQGRVVFSNVTWYSSTAWRVTEVILDPEESGYR